LWCEFKSALSKIDELMKRAAGKCIGGRGTILAMRFVGIIQAKARATLLRDSFVRYSKSMNNTLPISCVPTFVS
jgi:hypothetical protein